MAPRELHKNAKRLRDRESDGIEEDDLEYSASRFGGFEDYFKFKMMKLQTQDKDANTIESEIFKGLIFYVTGYTSPSALRLKQMIVSNSGTMCSYLGGKTYASYIIAENLTARKQEQFSEYRVVKPSWIVDCCAAAKLLDWRLFRTIEKAKGFVNLVKPRNVTDSSHTPAVEKISQTVRFVEPPKDESVHDSDAEVNLEDSPIETNTINDLGETDTNNDFGEPDEAPGRTEISWSSTNEPKSRDEQRECIKQQRVKYNCMDEDFLRLYYARSRLHLLSTSKLRLRKRCQMVLSQRKPTKQAKVETQVYVHVDFDAFFASASLLKRPDLADKPVCVSYGGPSSDVASCNYVARAKGVKNGQWVRSAKAHCPDLICLPYDFEKYRQISDQLYDLLLGLNPDHIVPLSIDEAILDLSSKVSGPGSLSELCTKLRKDVKQLTGLDVSVGTGPNILSAKLALRLAKPAGQRIFTTAAETAQSIADLDIEALPGVGRHLAQKLRKLEVQQVKDLARFSLSHLTNSFGSSLGQLLYDSVRGLDNKNLLQFDIPPRSVSVEVAWGIRFLEREEASMFLSRLVEDLWSRLTHKPTLLSLKVMIKAQTQPFVPPKFMGSGFCDTTNKSVRLEPPISLNSIKIAAERLLSQIPFDPLLVRGVGVHLKLSEVPINAPEVEQQKITDSVFKQLSPKKGKLPPPVMVQLSPRRRLAGKLLHTLTQMQTKWEATILNEIDTPKVTLFPDPGEPQYGEVESRRCYKPVEFMETSNVSDLRILISCWVRSCPIPFYEDAEDFLGFIQKILHEDRDWMKAIELVNWLERSACSQSCSDNWAPVVAACKSAIDLNCKK